MSKCKIAGKSCYQEYGAKRLAESSQTIKGKMTAYKCSHGNHWHVGHNVEQTAMTQLTQGSDMKEEKSLLAKLFDPTVMLDEQVKLLHQYKQRSIDRAFNSLKLKDYDDTDPYQQGYMWALLQMKSELSPTTTEGSDS